MVGQEMVGQEMEMLDWLQRSGTQLIATAVLSDPSLTDLESLD